MGDGDTVAAVMETEGRAPINLWVPASLNQRIRDLAQRERRTLTAQVLLLLERGLEGETDEQSQ